jgi:eukaryotic-like serine/threonine-protein kinase
MKDAHNPSVEKIFAAALRLPTPEGRAAYLKQACGNDEPLRRRVEALLHDHDNAGEFLDRPPAAVAAKTIAVTTGMVPLTEKPGDRIGRYKLLEQIGEGGCGVVYVAEQEQPVRRRVALKVIKLGMDTRQVIARFEAERQALALMDHPNIAKVLDGGATETGRPFFVMELVKGVRITDYCDKNNLSTTERLGLFIQVCHAIQHAHQKGIIHRDIKPSNILVTLHDGVPVPKVIDFGIAKATTDQRLTDKTLYTAIEQFIGTPAYMSPEQAELSGLDIDTRSDIYALGVLLYELLTGKTPFDAKRLVAAGLDEIRRIIREEDPLRPSTRLSILTAEEQTTAAKRRHTDPPRLLHLVRGDLDWIVMKCLEKDRTRRYETANGLAADLQRHLESEPVVARPPSQLYRFQKLVRRNRLGFVAATAIVAALVVGAAVSSWQAVRARRAEVDASRQRDHALRQEQVAVEQTKIAETARGGAVAERDRAARALTQLELQLAEERLASGKAGEGLIYLAQTLRRDPSNAVAAQRLISALTHRDWALCLFRQSGSFFDYSRIDPVFSADGRFVMIRNRAQLSRTLDDTWRYQFSVLEPESGRHVAALHQLDVGSYPGIAALSNRFFVFDRDYASRTLQVWNAISGKRVFGPIPEGVSSIVPNVISPGGGIFAQSLNDREIQLWNLNSGQPIGLPLSHDWQISVAVFSPDGRRLFTGTGAGEGRIWEASSGKPLSKVLRHRSGHINGADISPDNERIAVAWYDRVVILKTEDGKLEKTLESDEPYVRSVRFSPNGLIVASFIDASCRLWNRETGARVDLLVEGKPKVEFVRFSHSGLLILTAHEDRTARLWDVRNGRLVCEPMVHDQDIETAEFSPNDSRVVTVTSEAVRLWDVRMGRSLPMCLAHEQEISSIRFNPDGSKLVTASRDGTARLWDPTSGRAASPPLMHRGSENSAVMSGEFSADGRVVVTACQDGKARMWDGMTGQLLAEFPHKVEKPSAGFPNDDALLRYAELSADGHYLVAAGQGGTWIHDLQATPPIVRALNNSSVRCAKFSRDGSRVLLVETIWSTVHDVSTSLSPAETNSLAGRNSRELRIPDYSRSGGGGGMSSLDPSRNWGMDSLVPITPGLPSLMPTEHSL